MQQSTVAGYNPCSRIANSADRPNGPCAPYTVAQPPRSRHSYRVRLDNWPGRPFSGVVPQTVRALLRRGERRIVLDLGGVSTIDAAGIGELVRGYNMAAAANGVLGITNANRRVREMLERACLFSRLNAGGSAS